MPSPGDFFVVATSGNWRIRLVSLAIRWDTESTVNHAGLCRGKDILEAQPGGVAPGALDEYPGMIWSTGHFDLTDEQRAKIVAWANLHQGVGYGWLDILSIAFIQKRWFHGKLGENWLWRKMAARISNNGTLVCSQMVDAAYLAAGVHLFADGRLTGSVSPGDLDALLDATAPHK